jgi:TetR/AcrR family transcriptional repressor of nem operon
MPRDGTETRERLLDAAESLILDQGFAATAVDAILERAGLTKGAFFHHFPTKTDLAHALVERYAAADAAHLESFMARAERLARDPLQQLLVFVGLFEEALEELAGPRPGCLFASYCYEAGLFDAETHAVIRRAISHWRERLGAKLREVAAQRPPRLDVDLETLADLMFVVSEGAFVLSRTMDEREAMAAQLRHYRSYLELLFAEP